MTENPPVETSPQAHAEAQGASPKTKLVRVGLAQLLATVINYTGPAGQALEAAMQAHREQHPESDPVRDVPHFDVIEAWCSENFHEAARIVLAALYLAHGRFVAQEMAAPEPDQVPEEQDGKAKNGEGSAADSG